MREEALAFGREGDLFGILTAPHSRRDLPAVIIPNAGLLHHVGPHRMNVDLASALGEIGVTSLRFDLSGIGESGTGGTQLHVGRSLDDLAAAMDAVADHTGLDRFVIVGLCSGAYYARRLGVGDQRIVGAVLIDGYACATPGYHLRRYTDFALHPHRWARFAWQRRRQKAQSPPASDEQLVPFQFEETTRDEFSQDLSELFARRVRLLFVYTGGGPQPFNYEAQLEDAFPELDLTGATFRLFPDADHTFTLPGHRSELISTVSGWLESEFEALSHPFDSPLRIEHGGWQ